MSVLGRGSPPNACLDSTDVILVTWRPSTLAGNVREAKEEAKQAKGVLGKAANLAASALGMSGFMKASGCALTYGVCPH